MAEAADHPSALSPKIRPPPADPQAGSVTPMRRPFPMSSTPRSPSRPGRPQAEAAEVNAALQRAIMTRDALCW